MGERGPIPNRSDQLVRRNIPEVPIEKVTAIGVVPIPELNMPGCHPMIAELYEGLRNSAQSRYYEPSDWQYARFALHFANKLLNAGKPSAQMLATVQQMFSTLLMTEGDRRRVRMEVERKTDGSTGAGEVTSLVDVYRTRLAEATKKT